MKKLICLIFFNIFICPFAIAGGDIIKAEKLSFDEGLIGNYVLKISIVDDSSFLNVYKGCSTLIIRGRYEFWRWKIRSPSSTITYEAHKIALAQIKNNDGKTPLYFALIGYALRQTDQKCVFSSNATLRYFDSDSVLRFVYAE